MKRNTIRKAFLPLAILSVALLSTGCPPPPPNPLFSFAVIADPHLAGNPDYQARLEFCVDWINANAEEKLIELVFIVGDIAWGSGGQMDIALQILDGLTMPHIPIVGDNEMHGWEAEFDTVFGAHYDYLATVLDNWDNPPTPVWNPEIEDDSYFQNLSFDYRGLHCMGIDWCSRVMEGLAGEQADLHDFEGGTWPWFTSDIENCDKTMGANILMFTHHPMHTAPILPIEVASFSLAEILTIEAFTAGYGSNVNANLAGHYHIWWQEARGLGQYTIYVTGATHMGKNKLRLVRVYDEGTAFSYHHELVIFD